MKRLESLCRICSKRLGRVSYSTKTPAEKGKSTTLIEECFDCLITDNAAIYPPQFCNSCYLTMKRMRKSQQDGAVYRSSLTLSSWVEHTEGNCFTCDMVEARKMGGRPPKTINIKGCPSYLVEHIRSIAGPRYRCSIPLTMDRVLGRVPFDDLVCKSCDQVLDEPVELACKHLLCCSCCVQLLRSHLKSIPCPHCQHNHKLETSSFQPPPPIVDKLLQQLVVKCDREKCSKVVHLCDLQSHLDSKCILKSTTVMQSITVDQILQQPANTPPTQIEMEAAGHVVRKILAQSPSPFSFPGKSVSVEPELDMYFHYTCT